MKLKKAEISRVAESLEKSIQKPVDKGFVRFRCKGCDNCLDVSVKILDKGWVKGWYCNVCLAKNYF